MDAMKFHDKSEFHGCHGIRWIPWNSMESLQVHGIHGIPWILGNPSNSMAFMELNGFLVKSIELEEAHQKSSIFIKKDSRRG